MNEDACIRFTPIPRRAYMEAASPAERTRCNMDCSALLVALLRDHYGNGASPDPPARPDRRRRALRRGAADAGRLLGELQFAFLAFRVAQVLDGFEHWKQMVRLLCFSEDTINSAAHEALFYDFIAILYHQVRWHSAGAAVRCPRPRTPLSR